MIDLHRGDLDAAAHELEAVTDGAACVPMAHWLLAQLRRQTSATHHVERLRVLLQMPELAAADRAFLGFALHKELDDLERHDEAWTALDRACRVQRATVRLDEAREETTVQTLIDAFGSVQAPPERSSRTPVPIFIVGLHRSGTSLLERVIQSHPAVAAGGETARLAAHLRWAADTMSDGLLDPALAARLPAIDAHAFGERYLAAQAWWLQGRGHFTEKQPEHYRLLGLLRRALPNARVLHLVREPMATCWSNLRELFGEARLPHSYEPREMARQFARYRRLMRHWHATLPGYILDVHYEDLVRDPAAVAERVLAFCGLDSALAHRCIQDPRTPVRTASAVQVREPVHTRSLQRWRPYERHLQPMHEQLKFLHALD